MAKVELKTKETEASVEDFLSGVTDETARADSRKVSAMMEKATGAKPKMWGAGIVGFGSRHLKYESGRELDWMEIGFAPRKQNLTLYLNIGEGENAELLAKLGKHKTGKGCLHFKRLSDIDKKVLEEIINKSVENTRRN